jgi:molybdopterin synthase catalytic subunit
MKVKVKLFASVKDICGFSEKELIVSDGIRAVQIVEQLAKNHPDLQKIKPTLLYAINENYCDPQDAMSDNDLLAVFPPVSGG